MDFFARIEERYRLMKTLLCVGLDPRIDSGDPAMALFDRNRKLIDRTRDFTVCYKPNIAFYEAHGPAGMDALVKTIAYVPDEIPVIIDAKRCDIDSTASAYAEACFRELKADAVTLSPYMGRDAVDPFLEYPGVGVFLLCRTSNPGAGAFQDLRYDGEALYEHVARTCVSWSDRVGLVVAGNDETALRKVREAAPETWFLSPGIGAQGGDIAGAFKAGARADGLGILPVVVRAIAAAADPGLAARDFRDAVEKARSGFRGKVSLTVGSGPKDALKRRVMRGLSATECFKTGSFTLKSGKQSPFYVDLRRVISDPETLDAVACAYADAAGGLSFDRIAGIPAAALPLATAAAMKLGKPMVWPRMPVKDHGTGNRVEGAFHKGERVLLLDDLITTGASKLEAIDILRGEGLVVEDLVVLVERGRQGRVDMAAAGVRLHAFMHVKELFSLCEDLGIIDSGARAGMDAFVDSE